MLSLCRRERRVTRHNSEGIWLTKVFNTPIPELSLAALWVGRNGHFQLSSGEGVGKEGVGKGELRGYNQCAKGGMEFFEAISLLLSLKDRNVRF